MSAWPPLRAALVVPPMVGAARHLLERCSWPAAATNVHANFMPPPPCPVAALCVCVCARVCCAVPGRRAGGRQQPRTCLGRGCGTTCAERGHVGRSALRVPLAGPPAWATLTAECDACAQPSCPADATLHRGELMGTGDACMRAPAATARSLAKGRGSGGQHAGEAQDV